MRDGEALAIGMGFSLRTRESEEKNPEKDGAYEGLERLVTGAGHRLALFGRTKAKVY